MEKKLNKFLVEIHEDMIEISDLSMADNRAFIIVEKKKEKIERAIELADYFLNKWGRFREEYCEVDGLNIKLKNVVREVFINDNSNNSKHIFLVAAKENLKEAREVIKKLLDDETIKE